MVNSRIVYFVVYFQLCFVSMSPKVSKIYFQRKEKSFTSPLSTCPSRLIGTAVRSGRNKSHLSGLFSVQYIL